MRVHATAHSGARDRRFAPTAGQARALQLWHCRATAEASSGRQVAAAFYYASLPPWMAAAAATRHPGAALLAATAAHLVQVSLAASGPQRTRPRLDHPPAAVSSMPVPHTLRLLQLRRGPSTRQARPVIMLRCVALPQAPAAVAQPHTPVQAPVQFVPASAAAVPLVASPATAQRAKPAQAAAAPASSPAPLARTTPVRPSPQSATTPGSKQQARVMSPAGAGSPAAFK